MEQELLCSKKRHASMFYRVFKKKGNKVLWNYTTKKYISGALQGLISTTSTWHLIIYIRVLHFYNFIFILRHLHSNRNLTVMGYFMPILSNRFHQNNHNWFFWWFIDLKMRLMRPFDWARQYLRVTGSILIENVDLMGGKWKILPKNQFLKHILATWTIFFSQISPQNTQILNCPSKLPHLYHLEVNESSDKSIVGILV